VIVFEGKEIQVNENGLNFLAVGDENEIIAVLKISNRAGKGDIWF